jgi:hypothetical protein
MHDSVSLDLAFLMIVDDPTPYGSRRCAARNDALPDLEITYFCTPYGARSLKDRAVWCTEMVHSSSLKLRVLPVRLGNLRRITVVHSRFLVKSVHHYRSVRSKLQNSARSPRWGEFSELPSCQSRYRFLYRKQLRRGSDLLYLGAVNWAFRL